MTSEGGATGPVGWDVAARSDLLGGRGKVRTRGRTGVLEGAAAGFKGRSLASSAEREIPRRPAARSRSPSAALIAAAMVSLSTWARLNMGTGAGVAWRAGGKPTSPEGFRRPRIAPNRTSSGVERTPCLEFTSAR